MYPTRSGDGTKTKVYLLHHFFFQRHPQFWRGNAGGRFDHRKGHWHLTFQWVRHTNHGDFVDVIDGVGSLDAVTDRIVAALDARGITRAAAV